MVLTNFTGTGVSFGFGIGCGFGVGWGFGGGGCGLGLGLGLELGWGFGNVFGSQYPSSRVAFRGIEFENKGSKDNKQNAGESSKLAQSVRTS